MLEALELHLWPRTQVTYPYCILYPPISDLVVLEIKSLVVHFQGKAFNPGHLLAYHVEDVEGRPTGKGT
jgi:hypothetical protein